MKITFAPEVNKTDTFVAEIEDRCDKELAKVMPNAYRLAEYQAALIQAQAFASSNYAGTPPDFVKADMDAKGRDAKAACKAIQDKNAQWLTTLGKLRSVRLKYKTKMLNAKTMNEAISVMAEFKNALVALNGG